jgi:outer membrane biosynthesis protein TonB
MMTRTLGTPPRPDFDELLKLAEPHRDRLLIAALIALAAHVGVGLFASTRQAPGPINSEAPVEVELAFREPPPPPPVPEPEAPEPPKAAPAPKAAAPKVQAPPPAARAGAVLTALPDPAQPESAEPFDFTSDPNSNVYGSGVVAVGGTAQHGLEGARVGGQGLAAKREPSPGDGLTAVADLSQKPRLHESDPCRGFFPSAATDDVATATVRVVIGKTGKVSSASVVTESPLGQGFGVAARTCMLQQVFAPALDREGNAAATALAVNVHFSR